MAELTTLSEDQQLVSQELNNQVLAVLSNKVQGFQKAFIMATAIQTLKDKLTPEFMKPIMALQGSKLGFRTDKDLVKNPNTGKYERGPGYPEEVVKNCLIEMVLIGLQPTGNEFNIIGGNSYVTKEGGSSLLKTDPSLTNIVINYPSVTQSPDKKTANVTAQIRWEYNGEKNEKKVDFPVKSDVYTTFDALIGKAERKARMWLYNTINGTNLSDGDINDIPHEVVKSTINPDKIAKEKERERVVKHVTNSKNVSELERCVSKIDKDDTELAEQYVTKHVELSTSLDELQKCLSLIPEDDHNLTILYADKKRELAKS
jgi:hypothetical protein